MARKDDNGSIVAEQLLRELLRTTAWTEAELARRIPVHANSVSRWLEGRPIRRSTARELIGALRKLMGRLSDLHNELAGEVER